MHAEEKKAEQSDPQLAPQIFLQLGLRRESWEELHACRLKLSVLAQKGGQISSHL